MDSSFEILTKVLKELESCNTTNIEAYSVFSHNLETEIKDYTNKTIFCEYRVRLFYKKFRILARTFINSMEFNLLFFNAVQELLERIPGIEVCMGIKKPDFHITYIGGE